MSFPITLSLAWFCSLHYDIISYIYVCCDIIYDNMAGAAPPLPLKADVWLHFGCKTRKDTQELDKSKLCKIKQIHNVISFWSIHNINIKHLIMHQVRGAY